MGGGSFYRMASLRACVSHDTPLVIAHRRRSVTTGVVLRQQQMTFGVASEIAAVSTCRV